MSSQTKSSELQAPRSPLNRKDDRSKTDVTGKQPVSKPLDPLHLLSSE